MNAAWKGVALVLASSSVSLSLQHTVASPRWEWQNPLPQGNRLLDVHLFDSKTAIAVGEAGTVIRTDDAGSTWTFGVRGTEATLRRVAFLDALTGMAVGDRGTVLATFDGGASWARQESGTASDLFAIAFLDANNATAVGASGTVLRTTDGGASWTSLASGTQLDLFGVSFADANTGTAVGGHGDLYIVAKLYDEAVCRVAPEPADDLYVFAMNGMVTIVD
jgi:photosystem II stability/assembly factor-like uncharacterized protein